MAVLPSPVWAVIPTSSSFTVNAGSAAVTSSGAVVNISASDKAVLQWGTGNFVIGGLAAETWNFVLPANGAILNRVGNATTATVDTATINANGTLLSNGKVIILANGGIVINSGATINTGGGLVLSTIREDSDGPFSALGNLTFASGTAMPGGAGITIGTASVSGSLHAQGGTISLGGGSVTGDLILKSVTAASAINVAAAAALTVGGNLSVTTNAGAISGSNAVKVGSMFGSAPAVGTVGSQSIGVQTTTLNTGTGGVAVNLGFAGGDHQNVVVTALGTGGDVTLADANMLNFGASTIGNDLTVTAGGYQGKAAVTSSGTLSVGRNASFTQTTSANSGIDIRDAVVGAVVPTGALSVSTTNGAVRFNATGNLTTGVITTNTAAPALNAVTTGTVTGGVLTAIDLPSNNTNIIWSTAPTVTIAGGGGAGATAVAVTDGSSITGYVITSGGAGYVSVPTVTFSGGSPRYGAGSINITTSGTLNITGAVSSSNNSSSPAAAFAGGTVSQTGAINVSGTVTINSTAGNITLGSITSNRVNVNAPGNHISQAALTDIKVTGGVDTGDTGIASTFNATTGTVTLGNANTFATNVALNLRGSDVSVTGANGIRLGTVNVTNNLSVTVGAGKNIVVGNGLGTAATSISVGNTLNLTTSTTGTITDNTYSPYTVLNALNLTTGAGAISLTNASSNAGADPIRTSFGVVNAKTDGAVTLAETTTLNLGNISGSTVAGVGSLSARSITGGIVDSGNITVTGNTRLETPANANGTVVLDGIYNVIPSVDILWGSQNSILVNSNVVLGTGTYTNGNVTLTTTAGKNIAVGTGAGDLSTPGSFSLVSGGTIDFAGNVTFQGDLAITGNNTAAIAQAVPTSFNYRIDNSSLRGTVTRDSNLLSATWGQITGATAIPGHFLYSVAPSVTFSGGGATTAATASTSLAADGSIAAVNILTAGVGYTGTPTVIITGGSVNTAVSQSAGSLSVGGTMTLNSGAMLWRPNNFANVVVNNPGANVVVNDVNNLTISGTSTARVDAIAGGNSSSTPFPSSALNTSPSDDWSLVLGNLTVGSIYAQASNSGGGTSGTLTQAAGTYVHSESFAYLVTQNNNITVANAGNSFGRLFINANAGESRTINVSEDGTMKLGVLNGRGNTTLSSRFGSIIEDPVSNVVITNNGTLTLNANATDGSINIGGTTRTAGTTTGNVVTVVASAPNGSIAVQSSANLTLGNITSKSLSVASGNNVAQSGVLKVFGPSSFTAAKNITLTNEANNFGRVSLVTTSANTNIAITEGSTLNLGTVTMGSTGNATTNAASGNGTFTAVSVNGDIIDTGLGGARFGGLQAPTGALNAGAYLSGTGLISLSAVKGNIELNDPTTDFQSTGGLVFNAINVSLAPLGNTPLWLGAVGQTAVATGNLSVTSAIGNINNAGPVNVTGDAFFQSGNGDISMTNSSNNFGTVRFAGKNVSITEAGHMSLVTGSSATGPATFTTAGGDITIVNRGGSVSLASTGLFSASGNITLPKLIQAAGTLTVTAAGTKDLSKLSVAGDLGGKNPDNFGAGTYLPPLP